MIFIILIIVYVVGGLTGFYIGYRCQYKIKNYIREGKMFKISNITCIHHTKDDEGRIKALKVKGPFFGTESVWIPNFVVSDDSPVWHTDDKGILIISDEFAKKKGWV